MPWRPICVGSSGLPPASLQPPGPPSLPAPGHSGASAPGHTGPPVHSPEPRPASLPLCKAPALGLQLGRQAFLPSYSLGRGSVPPRVPYTGMRRPAQKGPLRFQGVAPSPPPPPAACLPTSFSAQTSNLSLRCTLQAQEAGGPHFPNPTQVRVTAEARRVLLPPAPGEPGSAKVAPASPSLTIVRESGPHSTDLELGGPFSFLLQRHFSPGGDPGSLQDSTEGPGGTAPGLGSLLGVEGV